MLHVAEDAAAAVVDEDDVHLAAGTGATEVTGVDGGLLTGAVACQQALEDGHCRIVGNELLDTHRDDVQLGDGGRHIGVALVGTDDDITRGSYAKVGARHAGIGLHELLAQMHTGDVGEERGVVLIGGGTTDSTIALDNLVVVGNQLAEGVADVLAVNVEGGHDDVARCQFHHLQDALAEVGLYDVDAFSLEVLVQVALLGEHTLALHHLPDVVRREDVVDDGVVLVGILRPVYVDAVLLGVRLELLKIVGQMGDGVPLDLVGGIAQVLPFGQGLCHAVAFLSHAEECIVVALNHFRLLLVSLCGL